MPSDNTDVLVTEIRDILTNFVTELNDALNGEAQAVERVIRGDEELSRATLNSEPEDWTEDVLIDELISALGLNKRPGRPNPRCETPDWQNVEIPDFELVEHDDADDPGGADLWIIGENKSVNRISAAQTDMQGYLSKMWWPNYGIATDGITWEAYRIEATNTGDNDTAAGDTGQHYRSYTKTVDLRDAIRTIAEEEGAVGQRQLNGGVDVDTEIRDFIDVFASDALIDLLKRRAPKELRDQRKNDVDTFYELYIELLFGQSDEYEDKYESNLHADIITPDDRDRGKDVDIVAVELVNRLLFLKFLEKRDILADGFLLDRVSAYNDGLPKTLYKTVFDPIFYELLNTPLSKRPAHQQTGWQGEVPYLNGGLFRETVADERDYDVSNRTLETVIRDLVEATEFDFEIDPAILGSVFEKTINHLSEEENRQEDLGAFYTPDDVTTLISQHSVQEKARNEILDAYAAHVTQENEFRDDTKDIEFDELRSKIEAGASWFGRIDAMQDALNRIEDLRVLDPACGSGHFLTAALDELHAAQLSLLRGLHGDNVTKEDRYDAKRRLVLTSIYGVDVDRVAVQIARLRTWLAIVDEGWEEGFDDLPNIELNVVAGNSLIGLPAQQTGQTTADIWDDRLDSLIALRHAYKGDDDIPADVLADIDAIDANTSSEVTKTDVEEVLNAVRPEFDMQYVKRLTHDIEDAVSSVERFDDIVDSINGDTLYPQLSSVKIERRDGAALTDSDKEQLSNIGCSSYTKSARLTVKSRHEDLMSTASMLSVDAREQIAGDLRNVLNGKFKFTEVVRRPVLADLDAVTGNVFHWVAEFPEVAQEAITGANEHNAAFDVILGNPPYGDVLNDTEKFLIGGYDTSGVGDIAAQFTERQFQLLDTTGYYGNIITLRVAYEKDASPVRDIYEAELADSKLACFTRRPKCVFEDLQVRAGIITGQKQPDSDTPPIRTSRFIRFDDGNRADRISNISYAPTEGLHLGETRIGSGENYSIPKLGTSTARSIIEKLKSHSGATIGERMRDDTTTQHVMWRRRGAGYWLNPMLENLYNDIGKDTPTSMYKMYFDTDLERRAAFLIQQSSLYYHYWMVYKNGRNIDWWEIKPFPMPTDEQLKEHKDEIIAHSDELWSEMDARFVGGMRTVFENAAELKPIVDDVDDLLGPLYDLSEDERSCEAHCW